MSDSGSDYFEIIACACCGVPKEQTFLRYFKYEKYYNNISCCNHSVCYNCTHFRGKCIACSSSYSIVHQNRKGYDWTSDFYQRMEWNQLCCRLPFMLPFTGTQQFGNWTNVLDISSFQLPMHPKYAELMRCYHRFVANFYSDQMLFHTFRTVPIRNLHLVTFESSTAMTDFFKNVASMAKFSRFSRKQVLNHCLFGLITLLSKRMIGEATLIQAYLLRIILKYCLAEKASPGVAILE